MNPDKPLIEQAWDFYFTHKNPVELRTIRLCVAEEATHYFRPLPRDFSPRDRTRFQDFTPNDLLQFARAKVEDAAAGHKAICRAVNASPREYTDWTKLAEIVRLTAEDGTNARQELAAFREAMRKLFGVEA